MLKNKLFLPFIVVVLLLTLVSAIPTHKQYSSIQLTTICENCTNVNLTKIIYPDGSVQFYNLSMNKSGTNYNITFSNTEQLGIYSYVTCGDLNDEITCKDTTAENSNELREFKITKSGFTLLLDLTNPLIIGGLAFLILISIITFFMSLFMLSGFLLAIVGFILLFSGIPIIISATLILLGVLIIFKK